MKSRTTARIHLLRAKDAPYVVIVRRKPSKMFHVMRWNTETGELEHGSWFKGTLYPLRSDISPDGQWMVYLAMGATAETWSGICKPPWLRTAIDWKNYGTWHGGGWWKDKQTLVLNAGYAKSEMDALASSEQDRRVIEEWLNIHPRATLKCIVAEAIETPDA